MSKKHKYTIILKPRDNIDYKAVYKKIKKLYTSKIEEISMANEYRKVKLNECYYLENHEKYKNGYWKQVPAIGNYNPYTHKIQIEKKLPVLRKCGTLLHEIGHSKDKKILYSTPFKQELFANEYALKIAIKMRLKCLVEDMVDDINAWAKQDKRKTWGDYVKVNKTLKKSALYKKALKLLKSKN